MTMSLLSLGSTSKRSRIELVGGAWSWNYSIGSWWRFLELIQTFKSSYDREYPGDPGMGKICVKLTPKAWKMNRNKLIRPFKKIFWDALWLFRKHHYQGWNYQGWNPDLWVRTWNKTSKQRMIQPQSPPQNKIQQCWLFSLTRSVLSIRKSCPKDKQSMVPSTW